MCSAWFLDLQGGKEKSVSFLVWLLGLTSCQNVLFVRKGLSPSNLATLDSVALRRPSGLSPLFIAPASLVHRVEIPFSESCTQPLRTGHLGIGLFPLSGKGAVDRTLLICQGDNGNKPVGVPYVVVSKNLQTSVGDCCNSRVPPCLSL